MSNHRAALFPALPLASSAALGLSLLAGCQEYYNVDEACAEKVVSGGFLSPTENDAMLRINCYRRLVGVTRAHANQNVQAAARGEIAYFQQNPDVNELENNALGAASWLSQSADDPGFTGINVYERLTGDPLLGGAGYSIANLGQTGIWEYITVMDADDPADLKSGAEAIDELMRDPVFRQVALQPSYVDGAFAEGELGSSWWIEGGLPGAEQAGRVGRVYYMLVLYDAPHFEHADRPVLLPKPDQTGVPLYSWSKNLNIPIEGGYADTQISYPITFLMGSVNPENYIEIDQNQYNAIITQASIVGPNGPLITEVVHPGDEPKDAWPSGRFQRTTLAIYTRRPFDPNTQYQLYVDLTTPEGQFQIDYSFKTAGEDLGVEPTIGVDPLTTAIQARGTGDRVTLIRHHPPGSLHTPPGSYP